MFESGPPPPRLSAPPDRSDRVMVDVCDLFFAHLVKFSPLIWNYKATSGFSLVFMLQQRMSPENSNFQGVAPNRFHMIFDMLFLKAYANYF